MAERVLMNEYKALSKEKWVAVGLNNEDIFSWTVALMVRNPDSLYYGGYFKAKMTFPKNYPYSPPEFNFSRALYHPNIYKDGKLCISILHPPGEDEMSGELAAERWSPVQRVESVLVSIISLLDDAEPSSPANVDAGVMLRNNPVEYKRLVQADVEASKKDIPEGFVMPGAGGWEREAERPLESDDFWYDSDPGDDFGDDFGGSDTMDEDIGDDDDEEDDEDEDEEMTQDEGEEVEEDNEEEK